MSAAGIIIVLIVFFVLLALQVPIAYAMAFACLTFIYETGTISTKAFGQAFYTSIDSFTLLAILAHPRTAWIAAAWAPLAALALLYAVVAKYAHYTPEKPRRQPLAARFGSAGFLFPVLLPLSLILTVSYALRAERNLNRYLHDYD